MKVLRIIQSVGYFALFLASIFNLVNQIKEKQIFGLAITLPLFVIALIGIICGIILITKNKKSETFWSCNPRFLTDFYTFCRLDPRRKYPSHDPLSLF